MSLLDGDWVGGSWAEAPAPMPSSTPADPEGIAAYEGPLRPLDEAVALGFAGGDWIPALVRLHGRARAGHRRWLALAGVIQLGRTAERGEAIDEAAATLWNDAIRRDPSRHPGLRGQAEGYREILGAALAKIAAAAPAVAEAMLLRGLTAEPVDDFRAEALATFRHIGQAPSAKVDDAARAMLRRVEEVKCEDPQGHLHAGVRALPNAGAFVAAYFEAGGGRRLREQLVAAVPKKERAALASGDDDTEALRAIVREMGEQRNPPFAAVTLPGLAPHLAEFMADAELPLKRRVAMCPVLADDPEATRLLLEEGDSRQFEVGAGRVLVSGAEIEPAWAERAKNLTDPRSPSPATLELLARAAPAAFHELFPEICKKAGWKKSPTLLYTMVGAVTALPERDKKLDARLKRMAKDHPASLFPIAAAGKAKKPLLEKLVTPVGWFATPAGALLGVPKVADAIIAYLESVEPAPRVNIAQSMRALERMGEGQSVRQAWIDRLCTILRDTDDDELARWASSALAYIHPGPEHLDAIVAAMGSPKRRARPSAALLQMVAGHGDVRAIEMVEKAERDFQPSLLRAVVEVDQARVVALAMKLEPSKAMPKHERENIYYYLTPIVARGAEVPSWVPRDDFSKDGKPARLGHAEIDAKERTKLFRGLCDGWFGYRRALGPAREALANSPDAMRAVLVKEAKGKNALRAFVAREALALGPSDGAWLYGEPTSGFASELPGQWHRWFTTERRDYVGPFHPSWTARVIGGRSGVSSP